MTMERPKTKTVACPQCGVMVERAIIWFGEREILANTGCLCGECATVQKNAVAAQGEAERHLARWVSRVPEDYHRARVDRVAKELRPALKWEPTEGQRRLGIVGPVKAGKTMTAALVVKNLGLAFCWTNGFAGKALYTVATAGEGDERRIAAGTWLRWQDTPLLVLDDVDKGNPTEAWASALFALLERRNAHCLPTIWTANHGPGALARKLKKCGDAELADAIERRLCGGALIVTAAKP
jgi:hypothetical protein